MSAKDEVAPSPLASSPSRQVLANVNAPKPLAAWIGDLWITGTEGGGISQGIGAVTSRALGLDWVVAGQPQTGWSVKGIAGVQGLNTSFPDRVPSIVALKPRLVVVAGGTNDSARLSRDAAIVEGVDKTVAALRTGLASGVPVVIVGPCALSLDPDARLAHDDQIIKAEAQKLGVPFIDPLAEHWITAANVSTYVKDGLLTQTGNKALADLLTQRIQALDLTVTAG